jgi:hypothetical protein
MKIPFVKYSSIDQLRSVVKTVNDICSSLSIDPPKITFGGTVKLHGTNGCIGWDGSDILYPQSRNHHITTVSDNAGFAKFVAHRTETIKTLFRSIVPSLGSDTETVAYLFGEWCGKGIQKGVAISDVEPLFVIFGCQITNSVGSVWVKQDVIQKLIMDTFNTDRIYHIYQFQYWTKDIDFRPHPLALIQNELQALTEQVEQECPVANFFGVKGIGEGIVWSAQYKAPDDVIYHLQFKVKGQKHSATKVKTLASVDVEKVKNITEFVNYAVTENRLLQGYDELFTKPGIPATSKDIGNFIRWIITDVAKEETDTMEANKLDIKDVSKSASTKARIWYQSRLN